jgi:signal transduction histidine kinase
MLEEKEKIFQPFVRFHGCSAFMGSGIGLAICERIVARHHGKIKVFN